MIPLPCVTRTMTVARGLYFSQTTRTSLGNFATPAGVILFSLSKFHAVAMLYLDQLDPFRLGVYLITHWSSSIGLNHPSIQPKQRASSEGIARRESCVLRGLLVYDEQSFVFSSTILCQPVVPASSRGEAQG